MRFIHTADLHLNISMRHGTFAHAGIFEARRREHQSVLNRLITYAENAKIDALFIAGDMFDDARIHRLDLTHYLKQLYHASFETYLIIGNHDAFLRDESTRDIIQSYGIKLFDAHTRTHSIKGITICGFDTDDFEVSHFLELSETFKETTSVCLLHGDVFSPSDAHYLTDEGTLKHSSFDYIALGHIHKHQQISDTIIYSGNPEPLDFSETAPRGIVEGEFREGKLTTTFVPFAKRAFIHQTLTLDDTMGPLDIEAAIQELDDEQSRQTNLYRITLTGSVHETLDIDTDTMRSRLKDAFYYLELIDETEGSIDLTRLKNAYKDTIIETLIEDFEHETAPSKTDEEALYEALKSLLRTEDAS